MTRRPTAPPRRSPSSPPLARPHLLAAGVLAALVGARAAVYLALGPGFVSDDWSLAGAELLDGRQGHFILASRPGSWVVFTAVFRLAGLHPVALFAVVSVLYLAVVLALYAVLTRFVLPTTALAVAAVWVLLPTHTTITVWGSTTNSLVGMTLALGGLLLLTRGRWEAAALVLPLSVLCYELSTPVLLLGAVLLPATWQRVPAPRSVRPWQRGVVAGAVALAAVWSAANSVYDPEVLVPNPVVFWSAHFGSGLFATADAPSVLRFSALAITLVATVVAVVAWARGERGRESGPGLVVVGLAVMAVGAWVAITLPIASHGVADRLYAVSSIGSALVAVGLYRFARQHSRALGLTAAVTFVAVCLVGTVVGLRSWSQAGDDSVALLRYLERHYPDASRRDFVVGPTPPYRNGVLGISGGHGKWAQWVWFGAKDGNLRTANDAAELEPRPGETVVLWSDVLAEASR